MNVRHRISLTVTSHHYKVILMMSRPKVHMGGPRRGHTLLTKGLRSLQRNSFAQRYFDATLWVTTLIVLCFCLHSMTMRPLYAAIYSWTVSILSSQNSLFHSQLLIDAIVAFRRRFLVRTRRPPLRPGLILYNVNLFISDLNKRTI